MDINFRGPEWVEFERWLEDRLLETYQNLANPAHDVAATERLRGRAQFIGLLLDLKNGKPQDNLPL